MIVCQTQPPSLKKSVNFAALNTSPSQLKVFVSEPLMMKILRQNKTMC